MKISSAVVEAKNYDGKYTEVFCNGSLCGFVIKIRDKLYHAITSEGDQCKSYDDIGSAAKWLAIQYIKETENSDRDNTTSFTVSDDDAERLASALKGLFERMYGECDCSECTEKREQEKKHPHPVH
ncbi:hypothetical protein P4464_000511 [Salmonella enterica]|nr:hypothetical protein [Salmonella enterica]